MQATRPAPPELEHRVALPGAEARFWSHRAGRYKAPRGAHASVELAWVERGSVSYRVGSREVVVGRGEAFFVPRGVEHATTFSEPAIAGALELSAEMLAELSDSLGFALPSEPGKLAVSARPPRKPSLPPHSAQAERRSVVRRTEKRRAT